MTLPKDETEAAQLQALFGRPEPTGRTNPRPITPDACPMPYDPSASSLVESLGAVADDLRQIASDLGARPYRLFSVIQRWSGGAVGRGYASIVSRREILPRPKVNVNPAQTEYTAGGRQTRGHVRVTELSPRLTADDIFGIFGTQPLAGGRESYLELTIDSRDGRSQRWRLTPADVPQRDAENFQWTVDLYYASNSPTRDGELVEATYYPERTVDA